MEDVNALINGFFINIYKINAACYYIYAVIN